MLSDFHQLPSQYRNLSRWSPRKVVGTMTGWVMHKRMDPSRHSFRCVGAQRSLRWGSHFWQRQFIALWQLWLSESSQFCSCQPGILVFSSEAPWDCVFSLFPHVSHDDKSCFLPECYWETGSIITEPDLTTPCILGRCPLCVFHLVSFPLSSTSLGIPSLGSSAASLISFLVLLQPELSLTHSRFGIDWKLSSQSTQIMKYF